MSGSRVEILPLRAEDRARWGELALGYKTFYETVLSEAECDQAWRRLLAGDGVHGFGAHVDGRLVGIVHYLFHTTVWTADSCYLQDLFVDEAARGHGVARALIERVAQAARERGASRLYWQAKHDNARARALYDTLAQHKGFIRYDYAL